MGRFKDLAGGYLDAYLQKQGKAIVDLKRLEEKGIYAVVPSPFGSYKTVIIKKIYYEWDQYPLLHPDKIFKNDIILDLGATVGDISIPLALYGCTVFSVEPVYYDKLLLNLKLNGVEGKIIPLQFAIAEDTKEIIVQWHNEKVTVPTKPLRYFLELIRNKGYEPTILKSDIEGAEWSFRDADLLGFRIIEMEVHNGNEFEYVDRLKELGYTVSYSWWYSNDKPTYLLVHGEKKEDKNC
ncbi:MAG TPA: hypothetical protein ENN68_04655 [Methanomicrobia archaeon]|nr:hypothetical protein [Methanomicrobia archaeon]